MDDPSSGAIRTVVITGGTSGVGQAAARALAESGTVRIVLAARDSEKAHEVIDSLCEEHGTGCAEFVECDLASFGSVRRAAEQITERYPYVDALIANAGLISPRRELTEDGHEVTFQVNHLSHFLLANLLRGTLIRSSPSRVIVVTSDAHYAAWRGLDMADLDLERGFTPFKAYSRSKLANLLFTYEAAQRWAGSGVSVNAVHPGVIRTQFGSGGWDAGPAGRLWNTFVPMRSPEQGAETITWLAVSPDVEGASGLYFFRRRVKRSSPVSYDRESWRRLWTISESMTAMA